MPSFCLIVEYNGTRFHGFQSQNSSSNNNSSSNSNKNNNNQLNKKHYQHISKRPRYDSNGQVLPSAGATTTTIQDCLQDAIYHWSGQADISSLNLRYCSRTDKGVHAKGQVVAITLTKLPHNNNNTQLDNNNNNNHNNNNTTDAVVSSDCFLRHMRKSINSRLPWDISVSSIAGCPDSFHPRHDVIRKQYSYTFKYHRSIVVDGAANAATNSSRGGDAAGTAMVDIDMGGIHALRNALQDGPCLWLCPWPLDDRRMSIICERLQGYHDYGAFWHKDVRRKYQQEGTPRPWQDIKQFAVEILHQDDDEEEPNNVVVLAKLTLQAKSFQRTQCRNMVGLVVDICRGQVPESVLDQVFGIPSSEESSRNKGDDGSKSSDYDHVEKMASYISAAPASGLCLDHVWYDTATTDDKRS